MLFQSLQIGRGFAALFVLFFHLSAALGAEKYFNIEMLAIPFSFGHVGVEFFFVLSGFIIFNAHKHEIFKGKGIFEYIFKRISRVYPVYIIIFVTLFIYLYITSGLPGELLGEHEVFIKSLFLFPQDKNIVGGTGAPILIVAWTLQYEIMFYFLFLLILFPFFISVILCVIFIVFLLSDNSFLLSFIFSDYTFIFLLGGGVCFLFGKLQLTRFQSVFCFVISILNLCVLAFFLVKGQSFIVSNQVIVFGVAFSFLIYSSVCIEVYYHSIFDRKILLLIGSSSYSLYLLHYPIISLVCKLVKSLGWTAHGFFLALPLFFLVSLLCVVASIVFHLTIEKPIGSYLSRVWFAYERK